MCEHSTQFWYFAQMCQCTFYILFFFDVLDLSAKIESVWLYVSLMYASLCMYHFMCITLCVSLMYVSLCVYPFACIPYVCITLYVSLYVYPLCIHHFMCIPLHVSLVQSTYHLVCVYHLCISIDTHTLCNTWDNVY